MRLSSIAVTPVNMAVKGVCTAVLRPPFVPDYTIGDPAVATAAALYGGEGFRGPYSKLRFWLAPLREVERLVPRQGTVLDLGCGEGILTNYLAIASPDRTVIGVELNERRIPHADRGIPNAKFVHANVLEQDMPPADAIVLSHMMHHLGSFDEQVVLLKRCLELLKPGGKLIVAEVDRQRTFKYLVGYLNDIIVVPILFEGRLINTRIYHRSRQEWDRVFSGLGYIVNRVDQRSDGPFPDLVIEATKPAGLGPTIAVSISSTTDTPVAKGTPVRS